MCVCVCVCVCVYVCIQYVAPWCVFFIAFFWTIFLHCVCMYGDFSQDLRDIFLGGIFLSFTIA